MSNKQIIEYLLGRIGSLCGKLYASAPRLPLTRLADKEREAIKQMKGEDES
jgi:hypothetical protein